MKQKYKAIIVNLDGYIYLHCEARTQRGFEITERYIESLKENFNYINPNGKAKICDGDLGGGCGSKSPNTWTSWSIDEMTQMLIKQGIHFEIGAEERMTLNF